MSKKILLLGPSGSGKTYTLLNDFENSLRQSQNPLANDFFFLLPSLEHAERILSVLIQKGIQGFFHRRVTTLSRLLEERFGAGENPSASNVTRYLILKELLDQQEWPAFEHLAKTPGLVHLMLAFITEMKESLVSASLFRERMNGMKKMEPDLAVKYETLAGLYEAYEQSLQNRGLRDRQDILFHYRECSSKLKAPRIKKIWMDGFFDFSGVQMAYLEELTHMTDEIIVTLTLETGSQRPFLFEAARRTCDQLLRLGFEIRECKEENEETSKKPLKAIARNIFKPQGTYQKLKPSSAVAIYEAVGVEGEAEMIARTIRHMEKKGAYRFSDFAVLLRQIGEYQEIFSSVFRRYGIPFEIHEREHLSFSPVIQTIVRLLKIFRDGWLRADLVDFLKSSYVQQEGILEDWTWELEHRSMSRGTYAGSAHWLAAWPESPEAFNAEKQKRLMPLAELEKQLRSAKTYVSFRNSFSEAVKAFFKSDKRDANDEYTRRDASAERRFYALLDEIESSLRLENFPEEELFQSFTDRFLRLVDLDLYSVHERETNRVQVYDVSLARQKEYRVVFLAGMLEKRFPMQIREDPVLSDWERKLFNGGKEGPLRERIEQQWTERYLFYLAITRASEKLFMTYPRVDLEGKETLPSYYVQEVKDLFDGKIDERRQELSRPFPKPEEAVDQRELEMAVAGGLWLPQKREKAETDLFLYLANELLKNPAARERFRRAFFMVRDELNGETLTALDPFRSLKTSATRLEQYAKCPFMYYANYVLELYDAEEDETVKLRGTILHDVLEKCFIRWRKKGGLPSKAESVKQALEQLNESLKAYPLTLEKKYRLDLELEDLREILIRFIEHEWERLQTSPLRPHRFEFAFGGDDADVPDFEISDGERLIHIRGKIDRVDICEAEKAGSVLDYKRTASFKEKDLNLGTALQLPIYLMVMEHYLKLKPAGAELYSLREAKSSGFYHENFKHLFPHASSRSKVLNEKEFRGLLDKTADFIRRLSREMGQRKMPVRPRDCTVFCSFSTVCRIEKWRLPLILEEIIEEDKKICPASS